MTTQTADWPEILKAVALEVLGQPTECRGLDTLLVGASQRDGGL